MLKRAYRQTAMAAAIGFCGDWCLLSCGSKLLAVHSKQSRDSYVFDCSIAEKKAKTAKDDSDSNKGASEDTKSDDILAFTVSPSGKLVALADNCKRVVLFHCEHSWKCVSIRFVVRKCTALVFTNAEDELLVADKSGDVYSFSVVEPQREGELKMGQLSMLLNITLSLDDNYIITADCEGKIRVSHRRSPYNIQSFCLGHNEFVTALLVPLAGCQFLLSGSGDGTVKLWDIESGCRLHSCDLNIFKETETKLNEKPTVCRIISSPDGSHIGVLCSRVPTIQFLTLQLMVKDKLVPHSVLTLPHCPLDIAFDSEGKLWVMMDCSDKMFNVYTHKDGEWQCNAQSLEVSRITEAFNPVWETVETSTRTKLWFEHLHKRSYDNVAMYMQKKEQRLKEQQLKRAKLQRTNNNKKARKETSMKEDQSSSSTRKPDDWQKE
ncbi:tRNA (guanine-N(7)-)-methyltransferase non-catalytic subunit wdr4 [Cynoglossus semilaevis]|nr:tRNA (guanine-N(7)-)-methyltransferase non-catalytic subunit WDR4 [Cynoglossus semilaevis]